MTSELSVEATFVVLLSLAAVATVLAARLRFPPAIGLLILGILAGNLIPAQRLSVAPDLVLAVLLPGLVFDAAFRTRGAPFRWAVSRVVILAVPGVVLTAVIVAIVLGFVVGLPLGSGFVVGAMVGATDPAGVVSTFRRIHAPERLRALVEGESLFNDGTGVVLFVLAVRFPFEQPTVAGAAAQFVLAIGASVVVGTLAGVAGTAILRTTDDHLVEAMITLAVAYGAYVAADLLGQSGLLATAAAGIFVGTRGRPVAISDRGSEVLDEVWEIAAFILAALAFVLVGVAIPLGRLMAEGGPIAVGVFAVAVARIVVVYGLLGGGGRAIETVRRVVRTPRRGRAPAGGPGAGAGDDVPLDWLHVLALAGMRGAVTVALALALPLDLPDRGVIQAITFGIVVVTLVGLGLAAGPLVPRILRTTHGTSPVFEAPLAGRAG
jgi:CPA1 family monovalent cation:H+ antiporter